VAATPAATAAAAAPTTVATAHSTRLGFFQIFAKNHTFKPLQLYSNQPT
jgi:hypothetical protein